MIYSEATFYSPYRDGEVTRLSTTFDNGGPEYFCLIDRERLKIRPWRELRQMALLQLDEAMQRGDEPGEIPITLDA